MSKTTTAYVKLVRDEHGTIIHSENADDLVRDAVAAEREACAKVCDSYESDASKRHDAMADDRNKRPVLYMLGKEVAAGNLACAIRRRG